MLVVEDERRAGRLDPARAGGRAVRVDEAYDGEEGEDLARSGYYDFIVLFFST
ncbi:MAG: hypothetical protein U0531_00850 [Dehalococcoidia bacterium]